MLVEVSPSDHKSRSEPEGRSLWRWMSTSPSGETRLWPMNSAVPLFSVKPRPT